VPHRHGLRRTAPGDLFREKGAPERGGVLGLRRGREVAVVGGLGLAVASRVVGDDADAVSFVVVLF